MYNRSLLLSTILTLALALPSCTSEPATYARASIIERADHVIGGPKALAEPGDFMLENDRLRVAILGARPSMGPGVAGGTIVDADLRRSDAASQSGHGRDQLAEISPTTNMNIALPAEGQVSVLADGADGGAAIVRVSSPVTPFLSMLGALWALTRAPEQWMVTDYILEPGQSWVTLRTTVYYGATGDNLPTTTEPAGYFEDTIPVIDWGVATGMVIGDFYLQGGSVDVFAPGMGFDEDGEVYEQRLLGRNLFNDPLVFDFLAGTGDGVSYGIAPVQGKAFVPLFTASQTAMIGAGRDGDGSNDRFPAGTALSYERRFFVGDGDVGSIVDGWIAAQALPSGRLTGHVLEEGTSAPLTGVDVFVYKPGAERPWSQWRTDVSAHDAVADGSFGGSLPVGEWELLVHHEGRPDSERVPVHVAEGGDELIQLVSPRPGLVTFTIHDEDNRPLPAKITLFRMDSDPLRNPILGDGYIAGSPEAVLFPMYGHGDAELADGTYVAVASRGLEYELDTSEPFVVDASRRVRVDLQLTRSVQSDGWISADLHVHANPSHDSGISLADRARTMAVEGVEFFAATDHDVISDYGPTIERLGLEQWVQSAVGTETTTVELGHFLAFPMQRDFLGTAGGAMDWTGLPPREILGTLRQQGRDAGYEPFTFVGHPRDGILGYFDQFGLDPYHGVAGHGGEPGVAKLETPILSRINPLLNADEISWDFDGIELLNAKRFDFLRTPTQAESDAFTAGDPAVGAHEFVTRTMAEQEALISGDATFAYGIEGGIDDWFTLLNLGFKKTLLGNSDTHGWTSTEAGCPRNFVMSTSDEPAFLDDQEIADSVRAHHVVASYGPFVQMWVDGHVIGDEFTPTGATVNLQVQVQAPTWVDVSRAELYRNGTLIHEWTRESGDVQDGDVVRLETSLELPVDGDTWYAVIVVGDEGLGPVFTPVEIPYLDLQEIVVEALGGVPAVSSLLSPAIPVPKRFEIFPFAITNPIWVDVAGDGFDAPGIPSWVKPPQAPAEPAP